MLGEWLRNISDIYLNMAPGYAALWGGFAITIWLRVFYLIGKYIENMWMAIYILLVEHKRLKRINFREKIVAIITWPIFDIIGKYTMYVALFKKVEWKQIPHDSKITISDIQKENNV